MKVFWFSFISLLSFPALILGYIWEHIYVSFQTGADIASEHADWVEKYLESTKPAEED